MVRQLIRHRIAAFAGLLLVLASGIITHAQNNRPDKPPADPEIDVVRVNTDLVTVVVTVKQRGKVMADLKRENFHLYEDGVDEQIAFFDAPDAIATNGQAAPESAPNQKPITIALLVDVSDSTEFRLKQIRDAAKEFVEQLHPDDRMLLISFDKNVRTLTEATNDRNVLQVALDRLQTGGGTSVYEAVNSALTWFGHVSGRKAMVLFTDGVDTASPNATYDSTIRQASMSDTVIYPIQFNTYADFADDPSRQSASVGGITTMAHATRNGESASEAYKRAANYLRQLVVVTGGTLRYSDNLKNLSKSFSQIATQLREQYTLGYYPSNKTVGLLRKIKVTVDRSGVDVAARKSYVYSRH